MLVLPPLSLYIHFPWCIKKCPYCDFNSHTLRKELPEIAYVNALIQDLEQDLHKVENRSIHSIFMGGGTPSLFSPQAIQSLLVAIGQRLELSDSIEITLEANPGAAEYEYFSGYHAAGINRLSLGIQSFSQEKLRILGRIHSEQEACNAIMTAKRAGFTNINLDLMHGLPCQSLKQGLDDLYKALRFNPTHISWYQLTIEPHTEFAARPPLLPQEDKVCLLQEQGKRELDQQGYRQYEISAYSRNANYCCLHNCNYWEFGDYLGIGAGAHSKLTHIKSNTITRAWKHKNPKDYLLGKDRFLAEESPVLKQDLPFEFMLNALRLYRSISSELFQQRTGLLFSTLIPVLEKAEQRGLLLLRNNTIYLTDRGKQFYNDVVSLFLPDSL